MTSASIPWVMQTLKEQRSTFVTPALTEIAKLTHNPFQVLISCILSLRTKDAVTAAASQRLYALAKTPKTIAALSLATLEQAIYPVGFYKTKAKRIKDIATQIHTEFHDVVPSTMEELLQFKGVGKKTAAITLVYGHKQFDSIPVDVHVHVLANRLGWVRTKHPDATMHELMRLVPHRYWADLNDLFVQFGQNICLTRSPLCSRCPLVSQCPRVGVTYSR